MLNSHNLMATRSIAQEAILSFATFHYAYSVY